VSEPIRPIGRPEGGAPPVPAVRRLTPKQREEAARERERKRKRRKRGTGAQSRAPQPPPEGGGSLDVRA
jgi:ribosome assembly protein YihI (activator of Der GTPase)